MTTRKILIVDDDRDLLTALTVRIRAAGYDVVTAMDSYQAIQHARRLGPDLLILDLHMPAGDGFTVQERMQKITSLVTTPVIYLTGDKTAEARSRAEELGAFALVHKPFEHKVMLERIEDAIGPARVFDAA